MGGPECRVEIKTDRKALETANFAIEIITNMEKGKPGWGNKPKADVYVFILVNAMDEPREAFAVTGEELTA